MQKMLNRPYLANPDTKWCQIVVRHLRLRQLDVALKLAAFESTIQTKQLR
jgi:hypothetical protein